MSELAAWRGKVTDAVELCVLVGVICCSYETSKKPQWKEAPVLPLLRNRNHGSVAGVMVFGTAESEER